jgi:hypothetical protein
VQVVTAPTPAFQFYQDDAEWVSGGYKLSNGWRMKVEPSSDGIVARIDKQRPMRLVAVGPNKYTSRDGNVEMEFNTANGGDDMRMSYYVPETAVAQAQRIVVTATLAQR